MRADTGGDTGGAMDGGPPPPDLDGQAAEYVLGTLSARDSQATEAEMAANPALQEAVQAWEARLAPLCALLPDEAPPSAVWDRIDRQITQAAPDPSPPMARPARAAPPRWRDWLGADPLWRGWAIGASAVAAMLAGLAVLPRAPAPRIMTVLVSDRSQPAWTAEVDGHGGLRLASLASATGVTPDPAPDGRALQLWALPPGATAPTSLGLLPSRARDVAIGAPAIRPVRGMLIEITLEPAGGSPIGRPTGPVLFIGRLSEAGPPT